MVADDGAHESEAAGNESEARLPRGGVGASGPFNIDAGGKGDGTAWPSGRRRPAFALCTAMAGQPETHIRCQDGPSNLVQCDAGDTMRHQQGLGEPWNAGQ